MGSVYLRGKSYVGKYKDENGNWVRTTLGRHPIINKTIAREILQEIERKVKLGQHEMIKATIPTVKEFAKDYLAYQRNVRQKRSWDRDELCLTHIVRFFGNRKLSDIKSKDIDDYKEFRLKLVKPGTVDRELQVLRHLFNIAQRWNNFFGKNPVSEAGLLNVNNTKERILTDEEEARLLNLSPDHLKNIIICALHTGMRKGEIISLKWHNTDLENNLIHVTKENSKSKKSKRIPVNSTLRRTLLELKLKNGVSEYVFLNSQDRPYLRQDSLNRVFKHTVEKAGIKDLRFHDLRHTAGTRLGEMNIPVQVISKILGHSDIRTTMRYVHPEESLRYAVEKLTEYEWNGHKFGHSTKET